MRYLIELAYKGTLYHGWQIQPNYNSVQEEIQKASSKILREQVQIVAAGRTDTGVHASQMFAHFDVEREPIEQFVYKVNSLLPNDIVIYNLKSVPETMHARFDAVKRTYEYKIYLGRNPFVLDTRWQIHSQIFDVERMNKACEVLFQYSDFECFSKVKTDVKTFNCKILYASWILEGKELTFRISANRFLRNMVRAIVGTLLEIGKGRLSIEDFRTIIEGKNRSEAGVSVPAKGLHLTEVKY